jgi:hypothetical protein
MTRKDWRHHKVFPTITLAGVAVNRDLVQHIAAHVDEPTASNSTEPSQTKRASSLSKSKTAS